MALGFLFFRCLLRCEIVSSGFFDIGMGFPQHESVPGLIERLRSILGSFVLQLLDPSLSICDPKCFPLTLFLLVFAIVRLVLHRRDVVRFSYR